MSGRIRLAEDEPEEERREESRERVPEPAREVTRATQGQPPPEPPPAPEPPEPVPEPPDGADEPPPAAASKPEPLPPEIQKRIDRENREKWEARREAELWRNRVAEYERQQQQAAQPATDAVERAKQELRADQVQRDFNQRCNAVYQKGRDEYGDEMDQAVQALNATGWGNRPDALAMLTAVPYAHKVYRALAANLDNAGRILRLPPMDMAMELAMMATQAPPDGNGRDQGPHMAAQGVAAALLRPQTQAPAPIRPVGGTTRAPERPLDKVSVAEFIRRRDRDESQSRIRR